MKNSLKQKLSLFLAMALAFTMTVPVGLITSSAATLTALDGDVTSYVDSSSITSSASGFSTAESAPSMFDSDSSTKFCGTVPTFPLVFTWKMAQTTTDEATGESTTADYPVAIQTYSITSGGDSAKYPSRDPKSWVLYGSSDGTTWNILDIRAAQSNGQDAATKVYTFSNTASYVYYKFVVTSSQDGTNNSQIQIADLQLSTTKLDADDDTTDGATAVNAAQTAATAFDAKLASMGVINASTYNDDTIALVDSLAAEYKTLDPLAQQLLTHYDLLTTAQAYVDKVGAIPKLNALIQTIIADVASYGATGEYDYHINGDITHAIDVYKSLSAEDQASVVDYDKLLACRTTMDEQVNNDYSVSVTGWNSVDKATKTPWLSKANAEAQALTQEAASDELVYQYSRQGYILGDYSKSITLTAEWGEAMVVQFDSTPSDNVGNPWNQANRYWAVLTVPFSGTAFSVTGYFALTDTIPAVSNAFYYDGKIYQQFMGVLKSYDYIAISQDNKSDVKYYTQTIFPGYDGSADITKNTFLLAYANYNQENKQNDEVVGIPVDNAATTSTAVYQEFVSSSGTKYIAASQSRIAAADSNNPQTGVAFVLSDSVASAITAAGNGDFAAGLEVTGAPIAAEESGVQLFENGIVDNGVYAVYSADNAYLLVVNQINALPTTVNASNYTVAKAAIEAARASYDALTANQNLVENYQTLVTAEAALTAYETDVAAAQAITDRLIALPNQPTYDDLPTMKQILADYDKLTPAQQAMVDAELIEWAQSTVSDLEVAHVEDMITALPEDTAIDGTGLDSATTQVNAANTAYGELSTEQKAQVSNYSDLTQKLAIIAAGGYTNWSAVVKGDVDGDKQVTVSDVVALRDVIMKGSATNAQIQAADFDNSGTLTVSDVVDLRDYIIKKG